MLINKLIGVVSKSVEPGKFNKTCLTELDIYI